MSTVIYFLFGLLYANAGEWFMHKFILHGLGKNQHSFWAYHFNDHHAVSTENNMLDAGYRKLNLTTWNTQTKELCVLATIVLVHLPFFFLLPEFISALYVSLLVYYYKHRKAHLDADWAKVHLLWHYQHHLSGNSNANWCITWPLFDYIMGTRT
jgi:hypothetical protein